MSAVPARAGTRLAGLDGLRGCACLLVFFYHLRWHARPLDGSRLELKVGALDVEPLLTRCDLGVAIFFVLSGLLLSLPFWSAILSQAPAPKFGPYLWRRACRILPAYYAVLLVVYLLREGTYTRNGLIDFALHATFLHTFADFSYLSVHPALWTIGIEFQFYLLLPLIMAGMAVLWRRGGAWLALPVLFLATWLLDVGVSRALAAAAPVVPDPILADADSMVVNGTIFSYLKLFGFGIAGGLMVLRWPWSPRAADLLCALALAGTVALIFTGTEAGWRATSATGWPVNALLLGVLAASLASSQVFARLFSARWLVAAGTISYGVYLWHELVQHAVFGGTIRHLLHGWPVFLAGGAIALGVTVLIATLSWRCLERAALRAPYPFHP
jgi:peptidoglycan/LPS O-acetylase OafA/YrhL